MQKNNDFEKSIKILVKTTMRNPKIMVSKLKRLSLRFRKAPELINW